MSWYTESAEEYTIETAAQFAGLAAIVNGLYNAEIVCILDDQDGDGTTESYTPLEYAQLDNCKIIPQCSSGESNGPGGHSLVTSSTYWYGVTSGGALADFNGKTIYLENDIDMGGVQSGSSWTGARYMPVGGQWTVNYAVYTDFLTDAYSRLGASFNGKLCGQGHIVANIYADRYVNSTNYSDSTSVGLIGRLGIHDDDDTSLAAVDPMVSGIAVSGYVRGRRSVGGVVGKIGQTSASTSSDGSTGGMIQECMNFADVYSTDSKGCGGIVGAGWNAGEISNCANFGTVIAEYSTAKAGGISGSNEIDIINCYNVGSVGGSVVGAIGVYNQGVTTVTNCYYLTGSAPYGYYRSSSSTENGAVKITDDYNDSGLSASAYMKGSEYLALLNGTDREWVYADTSDAIYN